LFLVFAKNSTRIVISCFKYHWYHEQLGIYHKLCVSYVWCSSILSLIIGLYIHVKLNFGFYVSKCFIIQYLILFRILLIIVIEFHFIWWVQFSYCKIFWFVSYTFDLKSQMLGLVNLPCMNIPYLYAFKRPCEDRYCFTARSFLFPFLFQNQIFQTTKNLFDVYRTIFMF